MSGDKIKVMPPPHEINGDGVTCRCAVVCVGDGESKEDPSWVIDVPLDAKRGILPGRA